MRFKLYWMRKLRTFKTRAFQKKNRSIAAASDHNMNKDKAVKNTSTRVAQENTHIKSSFKEASSFEKMRLKHGAKPSKRKLSQVVASLGCGSTVPLRLRKARHKPKVYSEEEDRLQAPPLAPFSRRGQHVRHIEDGYFSCKGGCLDYPHATTKRWVGACRCMQDVASMDRGSTRSDEALLSTELRKELRGHEEQAKSTDIVRIETRRQNKGSMSKASVAHNSFARAPHLVSESKQMHATKVEGSMSDRVVNGQKRIDADQVKTLQRWSSASARDYMQLKSTLTAGVPMSERSTGSIKYNRDRALRTSYDERIHNVSFDRRRRPQSITSVSTLSSYDFDRASQYWGSFDAANVLLNPASTTHTWQGDVVDVQYPKRAQRLAFSTRDSDAASVTVYTLSDCEDEEEEQGLLHTVSYATAWLSRNVCVDDVDEDEDHDDEEDDEYADCFIDLEANAKAWATARALSSSHDASMHVNGRSYNGSPSVKHDYVNRARDSQRTRRELDATALKRKYHKEYAGKQQTIVVSSHYEDDMNTFMFPSMSDYEDETGANPLKIYNYTAKSSLNKADQEGFMIQESKRGLSGDRGRSYHSLAVEKKSKNPYADFRDSMVDMVLQKQMYKSSELEELLQSFLCLNSLEHHDLIVQAFSEVWEKVFGSINGFHRRP